MARVMNVMFSMDGRYLEAEYGIHTSVAHKTLFAFVLPAFALGMIAKGRIPKDFEEFMEDFIAYNVAMIPVLGPAVMAKILYESWSSGGASTFYLDLLDAVSGTAVEAGKLVRGKADDIDKLTGNISRGMKSVAFPNILMRRIREYNDGKWKDPEIKRALRMVLMNLEPEETEK